MGRAPFQVLVFPYRLYNDEPRYAVFLRSDASFWQGISGGGEDLEKPDDAARREAYEEALISPESEFVKLQTVSSVPVIAFRDSFLWGDSIFVIPEYCYGVRLDSEELTISDEHREYRWVSFDEALGLLKHDGNKTALWELDRRIRGKGPRD